MTVTVRLDEETKRLLQRLARERRVSRSEVVRHAIRVLAAEELKADQAEPYQAIRQLIGKVRGGPADLSERTGLRFREALRKRRDRPA